MRTLTGPIKIGVSLWFITTALVHFWFTYAGFPEPLKLASLHLALAIPPLFLIYPARAGDSSTGNPPWYDWIFAVLAFLPSAYIWITPDRVYNRSSFIEPLTTVEVALSVIMTLAVLEAARRALSAALSILVSIVILYMFVASYLPGVWYFRPLPVNQVLDILYLMNGSGFYGSLTSVSATIVAAFLIFGAFLQASGMGRLFMNLGTFVAGRYTGGPAKVVVVESGLFGMTSGSSVANVVVTGSFTIPEMKRMGFPAAMAGGIEAASSVGGLLMPPIMGAAAFVMAEMISVPYINIVYSAVIGAFLYYFGIFVSVHYQAKKLGVKAMDKKDIATGREILTDIHFVIPLVVLLGLMIMRFSPYTAAFWATVAVFVCSWLRKHSRMGWKELWAALVDAGQTISVIAVAVAAAGVITAALTSTGLLLAFTGIIKVLAGDSLFLLVVLIAVCCLFLGMGVPTTPAYIITAAVGAPLLSAATDLPLINIHLFVLYFAVMADATPPVAAASYAAAAIAKTNPLVTATHAFRLAVGGFIVGLAYIYEPALTMNGTLYEIIASVLAVSSGVVLISLGYVGFTSVTLPMWLRIPLVALGIACALWPELPSLVRGLFGYAVAGALIWGPDLVRGRRPTPQV